MLKFISTDFYLKNRMYLKKKIDDFFFFTF